MSQAEELLNSLSETVIDHRHPVPDSDTYFLIDPYTRQIENTNYKKTVLMRGDHNSERFTFEIPRYVDGHDMSLCNRVMVHFDNVGGTIANVYSDLTYMDDIRLNPDNPETVISSWLIRREATQYVGILSFSLKYQCVEDDGTVSYEWNTDSYDDIEIRKSKNNGEAAVIQYTSVLEEWRSKLFGAGDSVMANITAEGETQVAAIQNESATQQAAIELKGSETLATIPDNYEDVYAMASEALRTKADGVVCETEGEIITLADSSNDYVRGLNIYGKSTQFTTTGKNLLSIPDTINNIKGVSFTVNPDRSVSLSGTPTEVCAASLYGTYGEPIAFPAGTYIISGGIDANRYLRVRIHSSDGTLTGMKYADGTDKEFTINDGDSISISMYFATLEPVNGLRFYPMVRLATIEDATYEPYTGGNPAPNPEYPQEIVSIENPIVGIYSSNLLKDNTGYKSSLNGITCEYEGDGVYHIYGTYSGTNPSSQVADMRLDIPIEPDAKYTLSAELIEGTPPDDFHPYVGLASDTVSHRNWMAVSIEGATKIGEIKSTTRFPSEVLNNPTTVNKFWIYAYNDNLEAYTADFRFRVWLTKSDAPIAYEPYTEQKLTVTHTISGIQDGQQLVCDEVDLERGVYIQRIGETVLTGSETYSNYVAKDGIVSTPLVHKPASAALCTHGKQGVEFNWANDSYVLFRVSHLGVSTFEDFKTLVVDQYNNGTPITIRYILTTPVETPLTDEEIETYKSLRTNYPITTVLNDSGAYMKVKYNADTKLYISNTVEAGVVNVVEGVLNDTY